MWKTCERACVRRKGSFGELEEGATLHAAEISRDSISPCVSSKQVVRCTTYKYPQAWYKVVSGLTLVLDCPMLDLTEQRDWQTTAEEFLSTYL
jgi:hypothetical protein